MPAMLTTNQVAQMLGCSSSTVRNWALTREIPCIDLGSMYRFDADEIAQWIESKRRSTGQPLGGQSSNRGVAEGTKKATGATVTSKKKEKQSK